MPGSIGGAPVSARKRPPVAPPERANFPSLFNQRDRVVENPPMDKVKRRYRHEHQKSGLV